MTIKFDARNYRKHNDKNKELINKSLAECGAGRSILIDNDDEIIAGNGVYEQAKALNIPVKIIETDGNELIAVKRTDLNTQDEKRKRLAVMDNSSSDSSENDVVLLQEDFSATELLDMGVEIPDITVEEEQKEVVEDEVPEQVETRCKRGDIWQLGEHRLMCGDSTKADDVEKLMNGEKADMVFTDPPYGMKKEKDGVLNDNLNFDDLLEFNKQWIPLTFENTKENGSWYCWGIDEPLMDIYSNILKPMQKTKQIAFRNLITWDKGSGQGQLSEEFRMYPIADEKCLFVMCGGDSVQGFCVNQDDYSENMDKVRLYLEAEIKKLKQSDKVIANALGYKDGRTVNHWWSKSQFALPTRENYEALREYGKKVLKDYDFLKKDYDELKKDYDELKKDFYAGRSYFDNTHDNMNNVWHFPKTSQEERKQTGGHATPKPIALCSRAIKSSSRENETVLDVFGGSGSTLIACEQLNRKCFMMELDEHYCDVIIQRWENLTGKIAELVKDK
jgi:DNA modification methylase